jgi:hypothetical protein
MNLSASNDRQAVFMTELNGDPILAEGNARIDKVIAEAALSS